MTMQKKKPANRKKIDPATAENFLAGADYAPDENRKADSQEVFLPWESPSVREDVTKVFNLRIPEPLYLKLKFLAENTPKTSMHKVCLDSIEGVVEHELKAVIAKLSEK